MPGVGCRRIHFARRALAEGGGSRGRTEGSPWVCCQKDRSPLKKDRKALKRPEKRIGKPEKGIKKG